MVLRLDQDEAVEVLAALEAVRRSMNTALGRLNGCGYSPEGVRLCQKRQRLDNLIRRLEPPQEEEMVSRHGLLVLKGRPGVQDRMAA